MPKTKEEKFIDDIVKMLYKGYILENKPTNKMTEQENEEFDRLYREGNESREKIRKKLKLKQKIGSMSQDAIHEYRDVIANADFYYGIFSRLLEREDYIETIPRLFLASSYGNLFFALMNSRLGYEEVEKVIHALNQHYLGNSSLLSNMHFKYNHMMSPIDFFKNPFTYGKSFSLNQKFEELTITSFPSPILYKGDSFDIAGIFYTVPRMPLTIAEFAHNPNLKFHIVDDLAKYSNGKNGTASTAETIMPSGRKRPFVYDREKSVVYMTQRSETSDMLDFTGNMFVIHKVFEHIAEKIYGKVTREMLLDAQAGKETETVREMLEELLGIGFSKLMDKKVFGENPYATIAEILGHFSIDKKQRVQIDLNWTIADYRTEKQDINTKYLNEVLKGLKLGKDTKVIVSFSDSVYTKSVMLSGYLYSKEFEAIYSEAFSGGASLEDMTIYQRYDAFERTRENFSRNQSKLGEIEEGVIKYEKKNRIKRVNQSIKQGQSARVMDLRKINLKFNDSIDKDIYERDTVIIDFDYALGDQIIELVKGIKKKTGRVDSLWATTRVAGISEKMQVGDIFLPNLSYVDDTSEIIRIRETIDEIIRGEYMNGIHGSGRHKESELKHLEENLTKIAIPLKNRLQDYHNQIVFEYDKNNNVHDRGGIKVVPSVVWQQRANLLAELKILKLLDMDLSAIDMESTYIGRLVREGIVKDTALAYFVSDHPIKGLTLANTEIPNKYMLLAQTSMMPFKTLRRQYAN